MDGDDRFLYYKCTKCGIHRRVFAASLLEDDVAVSQEELVLATIAGKGKLLMLEDRKCDRCLPLTYKVYHA